MAEHTHVKTNHRVARNDAASTSASASASVARAAVATAIITTTMTATVTTTAATTTTTAAVTTTRQGLRRYTTLYTSTRSYSLHLNAGSIKLPSDFRHARTRNV